MQEQETQLAHTISDDYLVQLSKDPEVTPETLRAFMDLRDREELRRSKQAYARAMTQFRALCPNIVKTKEVDYSTSKGRTRYQYAGLAETLSGINQSLASCNLAPSWRTEIEQNIVKVTCVMLHGEGHSEATTMVGPFDATGNKNAIQAIGSTVTYLERYTLFALLGLASIGQDDDGQSNGTQGAPTSVQQPQRQSEQGMDEIAAKKLFESIVLVKAGQKSMAKDKLRAILAQVQQLSHLTAIADCARWLDQHGNISDGQVQINETPMTASPERAELESFCIGCCAAGLFPTTTDYKTFTLQSAEGLDDPNEVCIALSTFQGKNDRTVMGKTVAELSDKAVTIALAKARKLEPELLAKDSQPPE